MSRMFLLKIVKDIHFYLCFVWIRPLITHPNTRAKVTVLVEASKIAGGLIKWLSLKFFYYRRSGFPVVISINHCSVPTAALLCRAFCLSLSDFWNSSSVMFGSRRSRKILHGKSSHRPQCSRCFWLWQQSYRGHIWVGIWVLQKGLPSTYPHPWHCFIKKSQFPQLIPQTAAYFFSLIA